MINKYSLTFACILLAILSYFPLFGHLDTLPVRLWDESRLAINAYEMNNDGDWIVTHFDGKPDMWNTKPPLMIWLQVGLMKCIGTNELSLRLPSAFAAFFTCALLMFIAVRYVKDFWFGFIAVIVLITSQGFIHEHASRTGDYDTLVTLFITAACLSFFLFIENQKIKYLYLFFAALILAMLAKGITVMLFIPALLAYSVIRRQFVQILKNKHFYLALVSFLLVAFGYYALREHYNPGYIQAVYDNELGGHYLKVIEGNSGDFWYFYQNIINKRLSEWMLLIPCGLAIGLVSKDTKLSRLTFFSFLVTIGYFLVISLSRTKLEWYDVPLFPFLSLVISAGIYFVFRFLRDTDLLHQSLRLNVLPYLLIFLICIVPYRKMIDKTFLPKENKENTDFYQMGYFLKDALKGHHNLNDCFILNQGYNPQNWFYIRLLQDKGIKTGFKDWTKLTPQDKVIAFQDDVKGYVANNYKVEVLESIGDIIVYKILGNAK